CLQRITGLASRRLRWRRSDRLRRRAPLRALLSHLSRELADHPSQDGDHDRQEFDEIFPSAGGKQIWFSKFDHRNSAKLNSNIEIRNSKQIQSTKFEKILLSGSHF